MKNNSERYDNILDWIRDAQNLGIELTSSSQIRCDYVLGLFDDYDQEMSVDDTYYIDWNSMAFHILEVKRLEDAE